MSDFSDQFVVGSSEHYLLSHSVGLPFASMAAHVEQHYDEPWRSNPADVWPAWLAAIDEFRAALAALFNEQASNFCPQSNVSSALSKIIYSLPVNQNKPVVLLSEEAFPSLAYVFQCAKDLGVTVRYLPASENATDPDVWARYLGNDVGMVLVTHVHSNTGEQVPVGEIVQCARSRGIVSVIDTAQSNGVLPIDLRDWWPDFLLGSCVKWLCGGPGAGFLWANPEIIAQTTPTDVGWFSHADPFEFDIHKFRYADDALRFWGGTPAVQPYVAAAHAIRQMTAIGMPTIRKHNLKLTQRLIDALDDTQLISPRDEHLRSGTVVVRKNSGGIDIAKALKSRQVRFDGRAHGLRLSPHVYNCAEDIEVILDCFA